MTMMSFQLNPPLDEDTYPLMYGLAKTRRMKRDSTLLNKMFDHHRDYGVDGEFFYDSDDFSQNGQTMDNSIINYNTPPSCQPDLWLHWYPAEDRKHLVWKGLEVTEHAVEWMAYIIRKILEPRGYVVNGEVQLPNSLTLTAIDNRLNANGNEIDLDQVLYQVMLTHARFSGSPEIMVNRILKMEMSPDEQYAIEIEDTSIYIEVVLSTVERSFSLHGMFSEFLFLSDRYIVSDEDIEIQWLADSSRAAVYICGALIVVLDLNSKRILKAAIYDREIKPLSSRYFEEGIDEESGSAMVYELF